MFLTADRCWVYGFSSLLLHEVVRYHQSRRSLLIWSCSRMNHVLDTAILGLTMSKLVEVMGQ